MPTSEARILANRENSKRSTGPRTIEGKSLVRCNALKHGMTARVVALPTEDQDEIDRRHAALRADFRPKTEAGSLHLRRYAYLSTRLERCERFDTKMTATRVRHAIAKFDDERLAAVEALGAKLYAEPATTSRRLQMTPEGIDWLLDEWETLRGDLAHPDPNRWTSNHRMHFDCLLGHNPGGYRVARIAALSEAMGGYFQHLDEADGRGLDKAARGEWAKSELIRLLDEEMARLKADRIRLDPDSIDLDRAEAVDRALFDPSKEAILARKYEAATVREMNKALKDLREAEAEAVDADESDATNYEIAVCGTLALNENEADVEAVEDDPESAPAPHQGLPSIFPPPERAKEGPISVEKPEIGPA